MNTQVSKRPHVGTFVQIEDGVLQTKSNSLLRIILENIGTNTSVAGMDQDVKDNPDTSEDIKLLDILFDHAGKLGIAIPYEIRNGKIHS
jgi:hypothetical protein